jgi:hypothetical protein
MARKGFIGAEETVKSLCMVLAIAALAVPSYAHHSFPAHYFEDQMISIEGEIAEFEYRSPHAWVHVMAKDAKGQLRRFSAEWSNPNRLKADGITVETLKAGDRVIIAGSPGRNAGEYKLHLKSIERPADGWKWDPRRGRR